MTHVCFQKINSDLSHEPEVLRCLMVRHDNYYSVRSVFPSTKTELPFSPLQKVNNGTWTHH